MFAILTNDIQYLTKQECTIRFMGYKVSPEGRIRVSARQTKCKKQMFTRLLGKLEF